MAARKLRVGVGIATGAAAARAAARTPSGKRVTRAQTEAVDRRLARTIRGPGRTGTR